MMRNPLITRLQPLLAILFAVGVLSAPAWHAAQAAQPAACCSPSQIDSHAPLADQTGAACCCYPDDAQSTAPRPTPNNEPTQPTDDAPCPDDGQCPCCKNLLVVSPIAPIQTGIAITDLTDGDILAAPILIQPDSRAVAIDIRPPIG